MKYLEKKTENGFEYKSWALDKVRGKDKKTAEVIMKSEIKLPPPILDLCFTTIRKVSKKQGIVDVQEVKDEKTIEDYGLDGPFEGAKVEYYYEAPAWGDDDDKIKVNIK